MTPIIPQIGIAMTGLTAIILTQSRNEKVRKYACLFGLAGQPFWFWSTIAAEQYGIVLMNCLYTAAWAKGLYIHWIKPEAK